MNKILNVKMTREYYPNVTVVYDEKTLKIYPFTYNDLGEVVLLTVYEVDFDRLRIKTVPIYCVDFENGFVYEERTDEWQKKKF